MRSRLFLAVSMLIASVTATATRALAQGVTTGAVSGTVTDQAGAPLQGVQIQVRNNATGTSANGTTRENGQFIVQGLEVGSGYTVTARRIGFAPESRNAVVTLGQTSRIDFQLTPQSAVLSTVTIQATNNPVISPTKTGVGTSISDSALRRLPTLSRDFTDFVSLTPQIAQTSDRGISGGGVSNRFNNLQIDGASTSDLFGLGSTGQPGGSAGAKAIGIESVKEYQVLLSPFDVRQGNFAGALINAVTKSGTNDFKGTVFYYGRNQNLQRSQPYLSDFSQSNYGFALGGPIIRNKAFFFVNPEFQRQQLPASGPVVGGADQTVTADTVAAFANLLKQYGIEPGSGGAFQRTNPLTNVFARVDLYLPGSNRLVLRNNYVDASSDVFSRDFNTSSRPLYRLTSNVYTNQSKTNSAVAQLYSNLRGGAFNELFVGYTTIRDKRATPGAFPEVTVTVARPGSATSAVSATNLRAGTEFSSQNNSLNQDIMEVTDNFTVPIGSHRFTIGTKNQFYKPVNYFGQAVFGSWNFASLSALQAGTPTSYTVGVPAPGTDGGARFRAATYAGYVQDQWQKTPNLLISLGLRVDVPTLNNAPPLNQIVADSFGRRTNELPSGNVQFSPRVSFNWDATGDQRNQVRGGVGMFTGQPPYVWLSNVFTASGLTGFAQLNCNGTTPSSAVYPPMFNAATVANPPRQCGGTSATPATPAVGGTINTIDPNLRFPQTAKLSFGYDHDWGNGVITTFETLGTYGLYNPFYQNLALRGTQGTDRNGRVLYGSIANGGSADFRGGRQGVFDVTNSSGDYSYSFTGGLQRRFTGRWEGSLFYTYSQVRDVVSYASSVAQSNWRGGRGVSGDITAKDKARSRWEIPNKIVATGSYSFPTKTDLSVIYTGQSGVPYDYVYTGSGRLGDMNADGFNGNDLIYVPKSVSDPNEIVFTGYNDPTKTAQVKQQQDAFEQFIQSTRCLRNNRGHIIGRNACRSPWQNLTNVSVAQSLSAFRQQNLSLRLDIFNFANLLNAKWGRLREVNVGGNTDNALLVQTGVTQRLATGANVYSLNPTQQGVFSFDPATRRNNAQNVASNYRLQLSLRYSF